MPVLTATLSIAGQSPVGHMTSLYEVVGANIWGIHLEDGSTNFNGQYTPGTILEVGKSYTLEVDVGPEPQFIPSIDDYSYTIYGDYSLANWRYHDYRRKLYIVINVTNDAAMLLAINIVPPRHHRPHQQHQAPQSQVMQEGDIIIQPQTDYLPVVITVVGVVAASIITALAVVYSNKKQ